jgi:hypothetical protein
MANTLQLKNDIKKLKGALSSKGLSASIKDKLKNQLSKAENELKSSQAGAPPRKVSTTKSTKDALDSLKQLIKKKGYGVYKNAGVDLKKDAQEGALATGRRTSQGLKGNQFKSKSESKGNTYYEYRANRLDVKQPKGKQKYPKLAYGGYMAKGGELDYDDFKKGKTYWNSLEGEVFTFTNKDESGRLHFQDLEGIDRILSPKKMSPIALTSSEYIRRVKAKLRSKIAKGDKLDEMAKGGMSQGYDDREDERLGMKDGKMSMKDLDSTHARRDDARFEERMADGGMIELQSVGAIYNPQTNMIYAMYSKDEGYKHKGKEYDVESGQDVDEIDDEYFLNALSQEDKAILFGNKMADGGKVGGRGWEGATKGERVKDIKDFVVGGVYLTYSPQFNSKNLIRITSLDKSGLNRPIVYASFVRKGLNEGDFAIWDYEIESNEYYRAKEDSMAKGGKLIGKQKNLDVNENGKLDAEDFKMLRGEKMEHGGEVANKDNLYALMELDKEYGYGMILDGYVYTKKEAELVKKWMEKGTKYIKNNMEIKIFSINELLERKSLPEQSKDQILERYERTKNNINKLSERLSEYDWNWQKDYFVNEFNKSYKEGGITEQEVVDSNAQMVLSKIKEVHHHADELEDVVTKNSDIEAWVVAKIERASTDLSDITHYLDGQHEKMSMGGSVYHHAHKMDKK